MSIIRLLVAILAIGAIMLMMYLFSTKIGPKPEEYTATQIIDAMNRNTSNSSISPQSPHP